jgi:hypothetical protein
MDSFDKINSLITYFTNLQNIVKSDKNLSKIIIDHIMTIISHIKVIDEESNEIPDNIKLNSLINTDCHTEKFENDSDSEFISSYETDTDDDETINDRISLSEYDNKISIHNIYDDVI